MPSVHEEQRTTEARYEAAREQVGNGRSIGGLFRELRNESTLLIRQEVELAKTEIVEKVSRLVRNAAYLVVGACIGAFGLIFLLLALSRGLIVALAEGGVAAELAVWLGPLIVGVVISLIAAALIMKSIKTLKDEPLMPKKTEASVKETKQWLKRKI